jgi:hypothetical protein
VIVVCMTLLIIVNTALHDCVPRCRGVIWCLVSRTDAAC